MLPTENQHVDQALLERIWRGEERAKEDLVRKYLPMVHRIVRDRAARWSDHYDDLCQEGSIGLLKAIFEYDPEHYAVKFSTFAYICILRRVSNVLKQAQSRKNRLFAQALSLNAGAAIEDGRPNLQDLLLADAADDPLEMLLDRLTEERLRLVLLNHLSQVEYAVIDRLLQGLSTEEIQAELSLGGKVIDNARTRARVKLRRLVGRYGSLLNPELPLRARKRLDLAIKVCVG
ncbi:MAG: sigma-70 family RNA polymerase sigma factor [Bacteroidota bacterium]